MQAEVKTGKKMFRKILRAQPSFSGPSLKQPIAANDMLALIVEETLLLVKFQTWVLGADVLGKLLYPSRLPVK